MDSRPKQRCPRCDCDMERHESLEFSLTYRADKYGQRSLADPPTEKAPGWKCPACGHAERITTA